MYAIFLAYASYMRILTSWDKNNFHFEKQIIRSYSLIQQFKMCTLIRKCKMPTLYYTLIIIPIENLLLVSTVQRLYIDQQTLLLMQVVELAFISPTWTHIILRLNKLLTITGRKLHHLQLEENWSLALK